MEIEILPLDFNFPQDLSEVTEQESENVRIRHLQHVSSPQAIMRSSELSPSRTLEPGDQRQRQIQRESRQQARAIGEFRDAPIEEIVSMGSRFEPGRGWIVEGEDPLVLMSAIASRNMSPEAVSYLIASATGAARAVSENDVIELERQEFRERLAKMTDVERDVEFRFGDL